MKPISCRGVLPFPADLWRAGIYCFRTIAIRIAWPSNSEKFTNASGGSQFESLGSTGQSPRTVLGSPRLFNALARKLIVCGVYSAVTTGLGRRSRNESPTPNFEFPTAGLD